jgi:hypothetical protein
MHIKSENIKKMPEKDLKYSRFCKTCFHNSIDFGNPKYRKSGNIVDAVK